jgi:hypothetical protein
MNINIKYYYKKATCLLFLLMLMATACTDNPIVDPGYESDEEVPVVLNIKGLFNKENTPPTYGLTDVGPQQGSAMEDSISDITVFIFNAGTNACDKIIQATLPNFSPVGPELVKAGNKKIIVVANGNGKFAKNPFYAPGEESSINYNSLRRMLTTVILPTDSLPAAPFLMTAEKSQLLQPEKPLTTPNVVNIAVERAVAKVKIFVTKSGNASGHALYLQKITLRHGASRVSVIENNPSDVIDYNLYKAKTSFLSPGGFTNGVIPNYDILNLSTSYCELVDTFYTFETLAARDTTKAVRLDFEVGVGSATNIRTGRVYLAENPVSATDTVWNVKRNYWYNVYVNIVDPGMDSVYVTVVTCPWNVAPIQDTIMGAGFEATPSSPFKLVKYYDAEDLTKDRTIAVIDKHSKGASWIDLNVTPGTPWKLNWTPGGANTGAILSADSAKTAWVAYPTALSGIGTNTWQRIHIYRPYAENNEPKTGPSVTLEVNGQNVRTFVVSPRDSLIFPTNSYVMRPNKFNQGTGRSETFIPLNHVYDFWEDFILANGDTIPAGTARVEVAWRDTSGVVVDGTPTIINNGDRKNSYIRAVAGEDQGNAIINFIVHVGSTDIVYWSFHLWNTEYSPYEPAGQILYKTPFNPDTVKNVFMDRNLGAMDTLYTPSGSAQGLYYQFGRKDPFPRGVNWTNTFRWYSGPTTPTATTATTLPVTTQPAASSVVRPRKAIPEILIHPTTFYNSPFVNHNVEDSCLWNTKKGNKTAFDPCPEGYRVPIQEGSGSTYSPWYGAGATLSVGSGKFDRGYYNNVLRYYPGSYIQTSGTINTSSSAFYWTSYTIGKSDNNAIGMNTSTTVSANINKATGGYIRCVIDKNYILNKGTIFGRYTKDIIDDL